jgi:hypothetical protein
MLASPGQRGCSRQGEHGNLQGERSSHRRLSPKVCSKGLLLVVSVNFRILQLGLLRLWTTAREDAGLQAKHWLNFHHGNHAQRISLHHLAWAKHYD